MKRGGEHLTDISASTIRGIEKLKKDMAAITGSFSYPETAYHLPITYSLTGVAVQDGASARQAFAKSGENPLVACECLLASKDAASGPEGAPYTGFIPDTVLRRAGLLARGRLNPGDGPPRGIAGLCR